MCLKVGGGLRGLDLDFGPPSGGAACPALCLGFASSPRRRGAAPSFSGACPVGPALRASPGCPARPPPLSAASPVAAGAPSPAAHGRRRGPGRPPRVAALPGPCALRVRARFGAGAGPLVSVPRRGTGARSRPHPPLSAASPVAAGAPTPAAHGRRRGPVRLRAWRAAPSSGAEIFERRSDFSAGPAPASSLGPPKVEQNLLLFCSISLRENTQPRGCASAEQNSGSCSPFGC